MSLDTDLELYYINLDHRTDRRKYMEEEFENALPTNYKLVRWSATKHEDGWIGCLESHTNLLKHLISTNNSGFYCILEDDCKINNKIAFNTLLPKYIQYLKAHANEWDLFMGGGIYVRPLRIVCKDPFIIECIWMTCSHFVIYNNKSAKKVIDYVDNKKCDEGIDNFNAKSNSKRIWVPYPLFCDQTNSDTDIGNDIEYLEKISKGFKHVHTNLDAFVRFTSRYH